MDAVHNLYLPTAQHEVKELIAGPVYYTQETVTSFILVAILVITLPMQNCTVSPK